MKPKQIIAVLVLSAVGLLIAFGLSSLAPKSGLDPAVEARITQIFGLSDDEIITIQKHEGAFYMLDVHTAGNEGGFWVLIKRHGSDVTILDAGNKAQNEISCTVLQLNDVPVSVERFCFDGTYVDRTTNESVTAEEVFEIEHPDLLTQ